MLSPEVWKFSPPPCNIVCKSGVFEEERDTCEGLIKKHYFNHVVSVVLPNTVIVPSPIIEALNEDSAYYRAVGVDVSELVSKEFLDAFVKQGQLSVLSDKTHIDVDDCVCITPCGHLVLCLQRETYLELGLEGKPSFFSHNKPSKYIVKIDLKASNFIPGKKNYDRVVWCLQENVKLKFDLLIAWESPDKICPSSVASYLYSRGYQVAVCQPRFTRQLDYSVLVPELGNDCSPMELVEWLGSFSLNVDMISIRLLDNVPNSSGGQDVWTNCKPAVDRVFHNKKTSGAV
ncbi:ribonuclease P protein subunit p40 isoform X3 [Anabrus simplex]|uniref:ribonuclease P protein subunit p40 isoform X3 n=1 Tax=Anabrus simplex TaxID=316456 RepID=UPI0034DCE9C2